MKVIFLDIDGVLNDHKPMSNGYCCLIPSAVAELNAIIEAVDPNIVIHSAWRYLVLNGSMTVQGFTDLLASHGVNVWRGVGSHRILGCTRKDVGDGSVCDRSAQILEESSRLGLGPDDWVALDDLELELPINHFYRTDGNVGLTENATKWVIERLSAPSSGGEGG